MSWPSVLIVADDLTGAVDSSAAFAARGMRVVAARSPEHLGAALEQGADVVAVSTRTREADADAALAGLGKIAEALHGCPSILFKKIDSRLKGHVGLETRVLASLRPGPALVCPAVPRLGRFVEHGAVVGAGISGAIPVARLFHGLSARLVDAASEHDLDRVLVGPLQDMLLVGASGLAEALARRIAAAAAARSPPALRLPALLAIGTRDPVTLGQIQSLMGDEALQLFPAHNGVLDVTMLPPTEICTIQMVPSEVAIAPSEASANLAGTVAAAVRRLRPATLFASGGECADAILDRLGVHLLDVRGEALPGLPVCDAMLSGKQLNIALKSGGFGDAGILARFCRVLQASSAC